MNKLNVLVVDDSILHRDLMRNIVNDTGIAKVEYTASNGMIALERMKYSKFDVILLDIVMPELDGVETLKIIRKRYPHIKVIMISEENNDTTKLTIEALSNGAIEFIKKPTIQNNNNIEKTTNNLKILLNQIFIEKNTKNTLSALYEKDKYKNTSVEQVTKYKLKNFNNPDIILIVASTGGPMALEKVLKKLDSNINKPILIVQHMPSNFTKSLAKALNKVCSLGVSEVRKEETIKPGKVLIAQGGLHMIVESRSEEKVVKTEKSSYINGVRPSADVLFKSIAREYSRKKVLAIILTGMGFDGREGIKALKEQCDCWCITQSEDSCVVYGMPKCVDEKGLSDESLDIIHIGNRINKLTQV
ncbi:chemotaxis-specific protein-glutamate methyltransferase CheB [Clostridium ganghwense]|uniref:Protein-glutamate methylesterase/protein-glutamine glutaminase n=1 Tax=Clostridium ganghwense TaxID=312089 RepID=A0ABT4CLJ8_9CLOT|nr:chemotaxis-specific protein-glutamate methyltransferase CheB [Clostridium ganghwense]MCY6369917.1 chemotaxis-specific protein-glutamate methyltransferase CheB [Clostridium ganghwense]